MLHYYFATKLCLAIYCSLGLVVRSTHPNDLFEGMDGLLNYQVDAMVHYFLGILEEDLHLRDLVHSFSNHKSHTLKRAQSVNFIS